MRGKVMAKNKNKKGFWKEFGEFVAKGNVLDLAVAVVIGGAFGAIVTSLTNDIIMPLVSWAAGANSIADLSVELIPATTVVVGGVEVVKDALTWNYGNFLQAILNFFIIAFTVFCFVKLIMKIKSVGTKVADAAKNLVTGQNEKEETAEAAEESGETK